MGARYSGSEGDAVVRRIRADDWRALRELRLAALADSPFAFERALADEKAQPDEKWREWAAGGEAGRDSCTVVADHGRALVGLAGTYVDRDNGELCLGAMWVAPEARGAGVGRRIVEAVLAWARDAGHDALALWVNEENASALRLYESCGFRLTGRTAPQRRRPERRLLHMRWGERDD